VSSKQGAEECSVINSVFLRFLKSNDFSVGNGNVVTNKKKKRKWQWVDMNGWTDKQMHVPEEARQW